MSSSHLFLGCTRTLRADWQDIIPEVAVPKNLKDPVKIQEARDAAIAGLIDLPILAYHDEIVLLNAKGNIVFQASGSAIKTTLPIANPTLVAGNPDAALLAVIASSFPAGLALPPGEGQAQLFGVDIKEELRIAALAAGPKLREICSFSHWRMPSNGPSRVFDVYEYVIPAEQRRQLTLPVLCKGLGIAPPVTVLAADKAQVALNIAIAVGLV